MAIEALRRSFGTSKDAEKRGVWVKPPLDEDIDCAFLLARMSRVNRNWATKVTKVYRQKRRKLDAGALTDEETLEATKRIFCETVLLDWRGINNKEGTPIPYSVEAAIQIMTELPDLYDYLQEEAQSLLTYQTEDVDATGKKYATTSAGS